MHEARALLDSVDFRDGPYDAVKDADVVVIVTEWDPFRALDLDRLKSLVRQPVIVDLRNIYRPEDMRAKGFRYTSIGRA
jgi:UDPglucose 6-dehydrogenase